MLLHFNAVINGTKIVSNCVTNCATKQPNQVSNLSSIVEHDV